MRFSAKLTQRIHIKNMAAKILLLDELLNSSSSSSDEEIMATLMKCKTQIPKVKDMMEIINEYSDKEVCYII